ncbi:UvrD-helicase domain-containing protein [Thioclava sp. 15-R06ZXC-3]|uniref:DNA 3'-5' helicase n=1 Tax=Thioclava arctica TaxID=3238301 RepID=A0ABV3TSP4_9RHOB
MELSQQPLLGFLLNPFGRTPRSLKLVEHGVAIDGSTRNVVTFAEISSPPSIKNGLFVSSITLASDHAGETRLRAGGKARAETFRQAIEEAWRAFNLAELSQEADQINHLLQEIGDLKSPAAYPAACRLHPILSQAQKLDSRLLRKLRAEAIGIEHVEKLAVIRDFVEKPSVLRARAIKTFVDAELARWEEFFDTVEAKPLTPEQRLSIVVDEDATLVLAGAGSGKTSVITAKAAYLLKAGIRTADQVLLLAFAKDAATEMSERVEARCGAPVQARTFHALAYDIIGSVEGSKPALAAHSTDDTAFLALLQQIFKDLVATTSDVAHAIINWFSQFLNEPHNDWDYQSKHDWYSQVEQLDLRTLQGEQVKSFEELQIANWLYQNGVAYEYEPNYPHPLPKNGKRDYTPDFHLIESDVYIEHFGVRRERTRDGQERLTTAPFVDREDYLAGMNWKRQVHSDNRTTLIETYSYERQEGRLLDALTKKLEPYVTLNPRPLATIFDRVIEMGQVDAFTRVLGTFLRQFKSGGYHVEHCLEKADRLKMGPRARAFLSVFDPVRREYEKRLDGRIDFEDMILRAANYVEEGRFKSPFRHILVDEFQDISQSRARLILALKAQHQDARVFAVGDDWQSIYRFAGSDIHIMRGFGRKFGGRFDDENDIHRTVDLGRTFRSVDKIALAARHFVLRNPAQITKTVIPAGESKETAIRVVWTHKHDGMDKLKQVLSSFADLPAPAGKKTSVLLLGRYRHVDPGIRDLQRSFPNMSLSYKTIHASKGLEADHVVLLGADRGRIGFPSEITDDPLLSLVSPEAEPFENAEERRVMYVAMTRARFSLTILASESRPSVFVTELLKNPEYGLPRDIEAATLQNLCGECGGRLLPATSKADRNWYRCEHVRLCGNILPACPTCGRGLPRHRDESDELICPACSTSFPACPSCSDGWLVERKGKYGSFLGCVRYPACTGKARKSHQTAQR